MPHRQLIVIAGSPLGGRKLDMATTAGSIAGQRPETVRWAVALIVAGIVTGYLTLFSPGDDTPGAMIAIGTAFNALTLVFTWGLWNLRRWGAIGAFVLVLLNTIAAAPGLAFADSGWTRAGLMVTVPASIVALVLIAMRRSRASYQ
jgi:hypothetical protein